MSKTSKGVYEKQGDLLAISSVGAYRAMMSSTYNTRLMVPEILVSGNQYSPIKRRSDYDSLIDTHQLAPCKYDPMKSGVNFDN